MDNEVDDTNVLECLLWPHGPIVIPPALVADFIRIKMKH